MNIYLTKEQYVQACKDGCVNVKFENCGEDKFDAIVKILQERLDIVEAALLRLEKHKEGAEDLYWMHIGEEIVYNYVLGLLNEKKE